MHPRGPTHCPTTTLFRSRSVRCRRARADRRVRAAAPLPTVTRHMTHIARWDLDKTYLRTEFETVRDLVRTALERPDEKRTNPDRKSTRLNSSHRCISYAV